MELLTSQSKKTILFYQPDRYTRRIDSAKTDAYLEEHVPCNFLVALTWDDFISKLNLDPDLVGFHCDLFDNHELNINQLIKTIETTLKLKNKQAKLFVTVNKKTGRETINMLRKTNIIGLQFGRGDFGIDYAVESFQRLIIDKNHWPEHMISTILEYQENKKPLHIYFGNDLKDNQECLNDADDVISQLKCKIKWCKSLDDLSESIAENPKNIAVHIDIIRRHGGTISEFMMMLETMIKYSGIPIKPNIGVVIENNTHLLTIKELQKHKILAIIPSVEFDKQKCVTAIDSMLDDERYWPKDIIDQLPGNEQKVKNKNLNALTLRQQEVFDLIAKRGLSNKQIARVLNISESTVKIHVSAVMKNLCVRNRTQLALTK